MLVNVVKKERISVLFNDMFDVNKFKEMQILGAAFSSLFDEKSLLHHEAHKVVVEYIKINLPQHYSNNRWFSVDFMLREKDGIAVSYTYEKSRMFSLDEEETNQREFFNLNYKDVFGWEFDFDKTFMLSEVNNTVLTTLKKYAKPSK